MNSIRYALLLVATLGTTALLAQSNPRLEGLWTGVITDSTGTEHKFELLIELGKGGRLTGKTYYHEFNGDVVEQEFRGKIHWDKSMTLYDEAFLNPDEIRTADTQPRAYQLLFARSAFGDSLDGFWQAHNGKVLDALRKQFGKVRLQKRVTGV